VIGGYEDDIDTTGNAKALLLAVFTLVRGRNRPINPNGLQGVAHDLSKQGEAV
jgi:hypothetical protein